MQQQTLYAACSRALQSIPEDLKAILREGSCWRHATKFKSFISEHVKIFFFFKAVLGLPLTPL